MKKWMKPGFHPAPFLCLCHGAWVRPGLRGEVASFSLHLAGIKHSDFSRFAQRLAFPFIFFLSRKTRKKVLLFLLLLLFCAAEEKSWDAREGGNTPRGVFLPSPLRSSLACVAS